LTDTSLHIYTCVKHFGMANTKFGSKIKMKCFILPHRGAHDFLATSNAMLKIYITLAHFRSFITTKKILMCVGPCIIVITEE